MNTIEESQLTEEAIYLRSVAPLRAQVVATLVDAGYMLGARPSDAHAASRYLIARYSGGRTVTILQHQREPRAKIADALRSAGFEVTQTGIGVVVHSAPTERTPQ